jgi:hypothetical protein
MEIVTGEAVVAGGHPQGGPGTWRNTKNRFNMYVFTEVDYLWPESYIPRYVEVR